MTATGSLLAAVGAASPPSRAGPRPLRPRPTPPGLPSPGGGGLGRLFRDNRTVADVIRVRATVRGRVQMVGFRAFVLDHADNLDVQGTVANQPDGSVECVVEGPRDQVEELVQWIREGPSSARVDAVDVVEEPVRGDLPPMCVTA